MTTFRKIITIISLLLGGIIYLISFLILKNKRFWVFGAWFGDKYSDNSKYFFEYVNKNHPEIRAVWLTNRDETLELVRKKGYKALKSYSIKGTWYSMRAKVGVISTWTSDINRYTISKTQIVLLGHGSPLKKIGYDDKITADYSPPIKEFVIRLFPFMKKGFEDSIITATSPRVQKILSGAFRVPENNVKITGYPRNDIFFTEDTENFPIKPKLLKLKNRYKIGIYLPTHRHKGNFDIVSLFQGIIDHLNSRLKEMNVVLLVKYHYYHLEFLNDKLPDYSNILFLNDDDINQDVYPVLSLVDFLITDYSSVFFDYLLKDKPVIFAPFDMERYLKDDRELYYNYDEITPGPKAKNWDELLDFIDNAIKHPDEYKQQRAEIRNIFNQYTDGNNSQRVFDEIIKVIRL